ncbi:MAG: ECF transporter S component [Lachnospiraceae bacterium]|nr:ECF transporter S component [Lachnospiraceae bacterium]
MKITTKDITFTAIGIALFVVLSMCLRVPVFENYYLCLGYIVMTVYIWCFHWYEGAIVGFLGVILYCIIGSLGFNGMPGWSLGNIFIGLIMGVALKQIQKLKNKTLQVVLMAIAAVIATFVGILIVKSLIDSVVVSQPFVVRFGKNMTSFIADAFVIVVSLPICVLVEKPAKKLRYE